MWKYQIKIITSGDFKSANTAINKIITLDYSKWVRKSDFTYTQSPFIFSKSKDQISWARYTFLWEFNEQNILMSLPVFDAILINILKKESMNNILEIKLIKIKYDKTFN